MVNKMKDKYVMFHKFRLDQQVTHWAGMQGKVYDIKAIETDGKFEYFLYTVEYNVKPNDKDFFFMARESELTKTIAEEVE